MTLLIHNCHVAIIETEQPNTRGDAKITTNLLRLVISTNNNGPLYSINYHILTDSRTKLSGILDSYHVQTYHKQMICLL